MKLPDPKKILLIILMLAAITRLYGLDYPNKFYFDEVYHAFTAKEYLKGSRDAWDPWAKPPAGVAYEWTHPPLAKEIMTASMFLFRSQDGWAWRLPGAMLGILSVFLVYQLGLTLLKNQYAALIASFAFSLDGLNFVQSRIGMNDIYFVTFMLLSLLLFIKKNYFWSASFTGLALASKWTAIYLLGMYSIVLLFHLIKHRDQFLKDKTLLRQIILPPALLFIVIPAGVYLASYLPYFLLGFSFDQFIQLQQQMWWYHTGLKATHGYSSVWWSWPLNLYPVWYFVDYLKGSMANIFSSGNSVLFWTGTLSLLLTMRDGFREKGEGLKFILLGFFIFWLPWALSPRIMFLYHFSPSIPFLTLSLGHQLRVGLNDRKSYQLVITLLILIALNFAFIYPFLAGIPLPNNMVSLFFLTNLSKNPF